MGARARKAIPTTHERATLRVPAEGTLRLALVADTHSHPHPDAHRHIAAQKPNAILHGGDIGDLAVLDDLATIAPVVAVRGNIDGHEGPPDAQTIAIEDDAGLLVKLFLFHIALYGPKLRADAIRMARAERASIVVCGHSHVPFIGRDKDLVVMNPGSIGPRRFQLPIVFGVMDVSRVRISMHHVSCETGARWEP